MTLSQRASVPASHPASALSLRSIFFLLVSTVLTVAAVVAGAILTDHSMPWYGAILKKPWFTPPTFIFPIAWTTFYFFMAFAFWRILRVPARTPGRGLAIGAFLLQLALNLGWPWLFFGNQDPASALLEAFCLEAAILVMILCFRPLDRVSAWLMWPYAAWVVFAIALNLGVLVLNRDLPTLWNGI